MVVIDMLSNATNLEKYYRVTNILCSLKRNFDVKSNIISILRVLENRHLLEIEFFKKYRQKGAVFILLEQLAEIGPSTHWIHISKIMIHVLRQWLIASADLILKDSWIFIRHVLNIIYKIRKKCSNMMYICEPMIVLILNSQLDSNQRHEIGECFNRISNNLTRNKRLSVQPNLVKHFPDLAAVIGPCGDFPCQYSLLEILIRWLLDRNNPEARRGAANVWFPKNRFSTRAKQIFLERTWDNFPKDARDFLNAVNHDEKSVISVQIKKVKMGDEVIIRSAWWWLDINMVTRSVSMMVPRSKLPLIQEPAESYSVALYLSEDNTDNVTLQRIGNENIVTMSSINYIQLSPIQKTTAWKTMTVSVTRQYFEIVDKSLKQIFSNKYKALKNIEKGIYPSEGETTNYYSESDFSRFSEPEKQNSNFAALKKFATPHYSSEKVPIATVVKTTKAPTMSNFDRKVLEGFNQAKSEATVGSNNDINETTFDKLLRDTTVMCENIGDVRKRDTPSLTQANSVEQLLSPLNFRKQDSQNLGIQGKFDSKTVEAFCERNFTESNLKVRQVTLDEASSEDVESVVLDEKQDVKIVPETPYCSSNEVINIVTNESIILHPENKIPENPTLTVLDQFSNKKVMENESIILHSEKTSLQEPKLTTLFQISNKKLMENVISDEDKTMKLNDKCEEILSDERTLSTLKKIWENENIDKQGSIENESIKLKEKKDEETFLLKDKPKILKKHNVHKTITKNKLSSPRLILNPLELKRLPRKTVSRKPKDQFFGLVKMSDNVAKNVSVNNNNDDKFDVYKFSYVNEILGQPKDEALLTKREKRHRTPAKYKTKGKRSKRNNKEISKTTEKRYTKASTNIHDETIRDASAVQLKDSELVKVDTTDKINEPGLASVKDSHMEIIAENIARENEKELSAKKKLRKRTKKIKENIAEENEQDISPFKKTRKYIKKIKENLAGENETGLPNKKQTKKIKDNKKRGSQKTPPSQLPTQIVETKTRDNENVKDISSDVIRNEKNDPLNKIEVYNDSSDGNENEKVNVVMPKENDVFDALSVHDSSSSLTLKTIATSSTIKALDKTYEPRNLEYEYLKPLQRDLLSDLVSAINRQENKCYEPKRTDVSKNISRESGQTANLKTSKKINTNKKLLIKAKSTPVPSVCLERLSSEKINLKTNKEVNINKKPLIKAKPTPVPSVCLERLSSEKVERILSESCHNSIREHSEINRNSKIDAKEITIEARVTIERSPVIGNKVVHHKGRELVTSVGKLLKKKRRLASRRESSVSEWTNEVDPRPSVPLSEHIDDIKKIFLEKIDTRLKEIQIGNTQRTLNMCVDMDKKLDEVFETQSNVNAQRMDDLGKHFCYLLKRENNYTTERWRQAFNGLHKDLKKKSLDLLEGVVSRRRFFMTSLRDEIDNMGVNINLD